MKTKLSKLILLFILFGIADIAFVVILFKDFVNITYTIWIALIGIHFLSWFESYFFNLIKFPTNERVVKELKTLDEEMLRSLHCAAVEHKLTPQEVEERWNKTMWHKIIMERINSITPKT